VNVRDKNGKFTGQGKVTKPCLICNKPFESYISAHRKTCSVECRLVKLHVPEVFEKVRLASIGRPSPKKGIPLSKEQKEKMSRIAKELGLMPPSQWVGDKISYNGLHWWLRREYGSANRCENPDCGGKSKKYEYALIHGKKYERKRENFMMLCKSCHVKYDMNEQWRNKIIKNLTPFMYV
jgi:hypothetical protein